jgi:hypothetical protein
MHSRTRLLTLITLVIALGVSAWAQTDQGRRTFATPEDAVEALLAATNAYDIDAIIAILGPEHRDLIDTTDDVAERARMREFNELAKSRMNLDEHDDDTRVLVIGRERWPFPIPIVRADGAWHFDTEEGLEEMLDRRIGEGELNAIAVSRGYVLAQMEYAEADRDSDEVLEYSQRIRSERGTRNGLYWETKPDEPLSPLGPLLAQAEDYLESTKPGAPYLGYRYRILTKQGEHPPGGAYDYVINGNMIAGFALIASPGDYGSTGIMTFIVNHQGKVYEKDLGPETVETARKMDRYDPDDTWTLVRD